MEWYNDVFTQLNLESNIQVIRSYKAKSKFQVHTKDVEFEKPRFIEIQGIPIREKKENKPQTIDK